MAKKKRVHTLSKEQFLPLLSTEFQRLGITLEVDGHVQGSRDFLWKLFCFLFDICSAATVAGKRLSLGGVGTFWTCNGIIKFRASKRYRETLKEFMSEVKLADSEAERFRQFMSYLKIRDNRKTKRAQSVERLAELM